MLVKQYLIETRANPTAEQIEVLKRFGVNVGSNVNRRYFTARLVESDARNLRQQHGDFIRAVSEDTEGSYCNQ